jgi:sugar lactone lactonase YvrE
MGANGWMLAAGGGFAYLGENGNLRVLAQPEARQAARMNDAACDSQGRFWAGSLADDHAASAGSLYVLNRDGTVQRILAGLTIPNGIGWSPNGSVMYLVDSGLSCVFEFDFDASEGEVASRQVLIELGGDQGVPDGLTVDHEGCLWVAVYGRWEVRRYTPLGELLERVPIPAAHVTCCCFGGPEGSTLFVTTAREGFGDQESREQPQAGSVFAIPTRVSAPPVAEFQPTPEFLAALTRDD